MQQQQLKTVEKQVLYDTHADDHNDERTVMWNPSFYEY